jgi:hypothetical protein
MTEVGIAFRAAYFGADHAIGSITMLANDVCIKGCVITGPATTCIKFGGGDKKRGIATHAAVGALIPMIPIAAREGRFGCSLASDPIFDVAEFLTVLIV